jgi:glucose dehydrogenase
MTGAYDPQLDTVYWTVGNPGPDLIGDDRLGDNLYTDSVVALDATTGALQWHFQFTPHDVWDYDAQEPTALVDTTWQGKPRDAESGRRLWSFQTSQLWKASPMTYVFDNQQYVAVASGSTIIAFGLR